MESCRSINLTALKQIEIQSRVFHTKISPRLHVKVPRRVRPQMDVPFARHRLRTLSVLNTPPQGQVTVRLGKGPRVDSWAGHRLLGMAWRVASVLHKACILSNIVFVIRPHNIEQTSKITRP